MHEMSLAESVVQIVEDTARRNGGTRVSSVTLEIGALAGVEIEALRFCFDAASRGTMAAGAMLMIDRPEGAAWCMPCGETVRVTSLGEACPRCGSYQLQVTGGDELRVREIELH
ncbi:MAG: hydrogenase nickel incorporation protein HypA [Gammaproteobacteria bacterium SG8_30]|jgi:hydrogenase nickel incorporation protein HypA/HybF|nr:MAG: hydrogenase nickel incorporation protein HypA [Gammaproteobacteria bacterium SG8_30]